MSKNGTWWLVGTTMLVVSLIFGSMLANWRQPPGIVMGSIFGAGLALVIAPLLIGSLTHFRLPWLVGGVFAFLALAAFVGAFTVELAASPAGYLQETVQNAHRCQTQGRNLMGCYVDAAPKRCEQQTLRYLQQPSGDPQRAWAICVESCADAGFASKHFGECRRQSF